MDNQHRKIDGYRELSQHQINLMNEIKGKERELMDLCEKLTRGLTIENQLKATAASGKGKDTPQHAELERFKRAEPLKWAEMGKASIQTGVMALVRAIAQPNS